MSYPDLLASGVTDVGRFDPYGPYLGGGDTTAVKAAASLAQWQVLAYNAAGEAIAYTGGGDFASGTVTFAGQPTAAETLTINGQAIEFVASGATGFQVNIGAALADTIASLVALITANPTIFAVGASALANVVTLRAIAAGAAGNAITLVEGTLTAISVSGATLAGGGTTEGVPSGNPIGIAAQPIASGAYGPIFISGRFDHTGLIWPAGMTSPAQRRAAFGGAPFNIYTQL